MTEPIRGPVRRVVVHYHQMIEDLVHAAKNEIVARIDSVDERLEELETTSGSGYQSLTDQISIATTRIRALEERIEHLEGVAERAAPPPVAGRPTEPAL